MMFWNDITRYLYRDAAEYGNFHQVIADKVRPFLRKSDKLIDIGCGHGYLTRVLYDDVARCLAVDVDYKVLEDLKLASKKNIETHCGDYKLLTLPRCDILLMSFFGRLTHDFENLKKMANRHIITIKNTERTVYDFKYQKALTRETHSDITDFYEINQLNYEAFELTLDFGQPFRNKTDIYTYLKRYKPITKGDYEMYIEMYIKKIEHPNFLYYLPKQKKVGIAVLTFA